MEQASIKFSLQTERKCHEFSRFLQQYDQELEVYERNNPKELKDTRDVNDAREKLRFSCEKTREMCDSAKKNPERRVYEMTVNTIQNQGIRIQFFQFSIVIIDIVINIYLMNIRKGASFHSSFSSAFNHVPPN